MKGNEKENKEEEKVSKRMVIDHILQQAFSLHYFFKLFSFLFFHVLQQQIRGGKMKSR